MGLLEVLFQPTRVATFVCGVAFALLVFQAIEDGTGKEHRVKTNEGAEKSSAEGKESQRPSNFVWTPTKNLGLNLDGIKSVIIEVGTNNNADTRDMAIRRPDALLLLFEPLTVLPAHQNGCRGMERRCSLITAAVSNTNSLATFRIGVGTRCSSLMSKGTGCGRGVGNIVVPTLTLDSILDELPADLPIELLMVDAQGTDFYALAGLKRHHKRIANLIFECQDLARGNKLFIYDKEKTKTCSEIVSCVQKFYGMEYVGSSFNMPHVREMNALMVQQGHPLANVNIRHPRMSDSFNKTDTLLTRGVYPCPEADWTA